MGAARVASALEGFGCVSLKSIFEFTVILTSAALSPYKLCLYTTDQSGIFHPLKIHTAYVFPPEHLL